MKLNEEELAYTAGLARLSIADTEAGRLLSELGKILSNAEKLNELDTTDVEPLEHISEHIGGFCNVLREDVVIESIDSEELMKCAPSCENGYYKVPIVVE